MRSLVLPGALRYALTRRARPRLLMRRSFDFSIIFPVTAIAHRAYEDSQADVSFDIYGIDADCIVAVRLLPPEAGLRRCLTAAGRDRRGRRLLPRGRRIYAAARRFIDFDASASSCCHSRAADGASRLSPRSADVDSHAVDGLGRHIKMPLAATGDRRQPGRRAATAMPGARLRGLKSAC